MFLTSKSSKINFTTAKYHKSRSAKAIINTLYEIKQLYETRGFRIENIHGDNEFNKDEIKKAQLPSLFHIYGKDEHVGMIERSNRTVKKKCRTVTHALPYRRITKVMTIGLVATAIKWLNAFPNSQGISKTLSPASIVEGAPKPNMKYRRIVFGSHAMVFIGTTNTLHTRSVPAVAINPSNYHGGHYFMSLYSGKRLHSYNWEELPIDDGVTDRLESLAEDEGAPVMESALPMFTWRQRSIAGLNIDVVEDDADIIEEVQPEQTMDEDDAIDDDIEEGESDNDNLITYEESDDELLSFDDSDSNENDDEAIMSDNSEGSTIEEAVAAPIEEETDNEEVLHVYESDDDDNNATLETIREEEGETEEDGEEQQSVHDENEVVPLRRSTREGAGQGVERLEMSLDNNE